MKGTCVRALLISQCLTGQLIFEEKIFSKLYPPKNLKKYVAIKHYSENIKFISLIEMILESNGILLSIYEFFTGLFRLILNAQIPDYCLKTHFDNKCIFI